MHNLQAYRIYQKWACIFAIIQAVGLLDAGYLLGDSPVDRCVKSDKSLTNICEEVVVVVLRGFFYVPPTAKVIRRRDLRSKSHPKDWKSTGLYTPKKYDIKRRSTESHFYFRHLF